MEISSPPLPIALPPRRSCDFSTSLEFEFNPCFPSPTALPSADELFFGGIILPLRLLPTHHHNSDSDPGPPPPPPPDPDPHPNPLNSSSNANPDSVSDPPHTDPEPGPGPPLVSVSDPSPSILSAGITASKRWRDIFKKSPTEETKDKHKEKKKDRKKGGSGASGGNSAELNINLWPFSRSRSAGNNAAGRPRSAVAARKVSSAPCSRSNSAGESKSRRWPSSPARPGSTGVHLGRNSPVWQLPRTVSSRGEKGKKDSAPAEGNRRSKAVKGSANATGGGGKARVLNLNVPMCIGYRHHLSCRSDGTSAIGTGTGDSGGQDGGSRTVGGGNLFNLRRLLFSKKVY